MNNALENAAYIMDSRNRRHGWPKNFDQDTMTFTVEMDMYLTLKEAAAKGLPTPEELLGDQPMDYEPNDPAINHGHVHGRQFIGPMQARGPWSPLNILDWEVRSDNSVAFLYEDAQVKAHAQFQVCDGCNGKGTHVNPNIDCMGISSEQFDRDPEFQEAYFSGAYDQPCNACEGKRVYPVIDRQSTDAEIIHYIDETEREAQYDLAERAAEARMGC